MSNIIHRLKAIFGANIKSTVVKRLVVTGTTSQGVTLPPQEASSSEGSGGSAQYIEPKGE